MTTSRPRPRPVTDVSAAAWVEAEVGAFASGVKGLLPGRFERYARVLHPAGHGDDPDRPVPWATVAAWAGREMHAGAQFEKISRARDGAGQGPPPWDLPPEGGAPPRELLEAVCDVLARHTSCPERSWFCVWDGWGWVAGSPGVASVGAERSSDLPPAFPAEVLSGPRVRLPERDYLLLEGPLASITEIGWRVGELTASALSGVELDVSEFSPQPPSLFWPDDRSWCVASEIDLDSTYVGGSSAAIADLLHDERLEAWPAALDDPIGLGSDVVNSS